MPQISPKPYNAYLKRIFDIALSLISIGLFSAPMMMIAILVKLTSPGPILHWSSRVGENNRLFRMPKFRTMSVDTPPMATHLLNNPQQYVTRVGAFLRKTSLDELPQLFSVLHGKMSFVGPRPALFNQDDLVALRSAKNIHRIKPGITGWAQVNGRDELPIPIKVARDAYYAQHRNFKLDLKILLMTLLKVTRREGIDH
jgi:O-antigen biosynthesis protein WbqP